MAVRTFNGSTDRVDLIAGGLTGWTTGTVAVLCKASAVADARTLFCWVSSGVAYIHTPYQVQGDESVLWDGATAWAASTQPTAVWTLCVVRKATGSNTPRLSIYNLSTGAWTHTNAGSAVADIAARGSTDRVTQATNSGVETWEGQIAVMAAWSNATPFTADSSGDAVLEAAGLHLFLSNWVSLSPTALWPFNQSTTALAVRDSVGTSHQIAISGTSVTLNDEPPGFSFGGPGVVHTRPLVVGRIGPDRRVQLLRRFDDSPSEVVADATVTLTTIDRSFTVPQVAVSVGAEPATVARSFTLPQTTAAVGATPSVISRAFTIPRPDVSVEAVPATIPLAFTLPQVTGTESTLVTLTTIDRAFTLPQVTVAVGATPAVIVRAFALNQAAVSVGATPATIVRAFTLNQTTAGVGASAAVIARAFTMPQPDVSVGVILGTIARDFTLPQLTATGAGSGDASVVLSTITLAFALNQLAVSVGATPAVIARAFTIPQTTAGVGAIPAVITRSFTLPQVTVAVGVSLSTISLAFVLPQVSASGTSPDALVSPETIALAFALPDLLIDSGIISKPWKLLGGGSAQRGPQKYANRRPGWT